VKLIITVDNGISSIAEAALARELGMDVVVTDHHRPQKQLPEAAAVVDAYRKDDLSPFKDFSGAGVVLKLLIALEDGDQEAVFRGILRFGGVGHRRRCGAPIGRKQGDCKGGAETFVPGGASWG